MRKLSAHYYLRPDGKFGKRPIIQLDNEGRIINIRETGDAFKEEPGLEYYPGILIPGFVASYAETNTEIVKRIKAQAFSNGVLRLKPDHELLSSAEYIKVWTALMQDVTPERTLMNLSHYLILHTATAAQLLNESEWGVIRVGAKPGLLVLQNINLKSFSVSVKSTFRVLQK